MLNLVLYQPDIPQNLGACLRLSACMGAKIHVVEPCGFPFDHAKLRRAGMDYIAKAEYIRHLNWDAFLEYRKNDDARRVASHGEPCDNAENFLRRVPSRTAAHASGGVGVIPPSRLLLLETDGTTRYSEFTYEPTDYIVIGSEGAGTPRELYGQMDELLTIPMRDGVRSLNMAMSAGILLAEACRQRNWKFAA